MRSLKTPVLVALVAIGTIAVAGACGPDAAPHQPVCPSAGCSVPTGPAQDPPAWVAACLDTDNQGPCTGIAVGTDEACHWWYVEAGHNLYDGTARDLGIWELGPGEKVAEACV